MHRRKSPPLGAALCRSHATTAASPPPATAKLYRLSRIGPPVDRAPHANRGSLVTARYQRVQRPCPRFVPGDDPGLCRGRLYSRLRPWYGCDARRVAPIARAPGVASSASRAPISAGDRRRPELGAAPDHVLGRAGPLLLHEIAHLGLGQARAEIPAEIRGRFGASEHRATRACRRRGPGGRMGPGQERVAARQARGQQRQARRVRTLRPAAAVAPVQPAASLVPARQMRGASRSSTASARRR